MKNLINNGVIYLIDTSTGEIIESHTPVTGLLTRYYSEGPTKPKWYIAEGLDKPKRGRKPTPTIPASQCSTSSELKHTVGKLDHFIDRYTYPSVNHAGICQSVLEQLLTVGEATTLMALCQNITAWNIWYGTTKDIQLQSGMGKTAIYQHIASLTKKNLIKEFNNKITIHPWYVWKGDYRYRDSYLDQWVNPSHSYYK